MLRIISPGLQATLQGMPRRGWRHMGIPSAGPADPLSMALANRLVGNAPFATSIEITYGGFELEAHRDCSLAVTGACGDIFLSGNSAKPHATIHMETGERLTIKPSSVGMRTYIAVAGGVQAQEIFGSTSTYLPASFGGLDGRALQSGDELKFLAEARSVETLVTPVEYQPVITNNFALRAGPSAETDLLTAISKDALFKRTFKVGRQGTRMGVTLEGQYLNLRSNGLMKSAAVYPGTIQCPESGIPIVLLCDAQTTGGYPRVAHIARCDRHLLGQVRPGDTVRLLHRSHTEAAKDDEKKTRFLRAWLNDYP